MNCEFRLKFEEMTVAASTDSGVNIFYHSPPSVKYIFWGIIGLLITGKEIILDGYEGSWEKKVKFAPYLRGKISFWTIGKGGGDSFVVENMYP